MGRIHIIRDGKQRYGRRQLCSPHIATVALRIVASSASCGGPPRTRSRALGCRWGDAEGSRYCCRRGCHVTCWGEQQPKRWGRGRCWRWKCIACPARFSHVDRGEQQAPPGEAGARARFVLVIRTTRPSSAACGAGRGRDLGICQAAAASWLEAEQCRCCASEASSSGATPRAHAACSAGCSYKTAHRATDSDRGCECCC